MNKTALMALIGSFAVLSSANAGIFTNKNKVVSSRGSCTSTDRVYQIQHEEIKVTNKKTGLWEKYERLINIKNTKTGETIKATGDNGVFNKNLSFSFMDGPLKKVMSLKIENSDRSISTINANCNSVVTEGVPSVSTRRIAKKVFLNIPKNLFVDTAENYETFWAVDTYLNKNTSDRMLAVGVPKTKCMITRLELPFYQGPGDENIKLEMTQVLPSEHITFMAQSANFWYQVNCMELLKEPNTETSMSIENVIWKSTQHYSEAEVLKTLKSNFPAKMIEF